MRRDMAKKATTSNNKKSPISTARLSNRLLSKLYRDLPQGVATSLIAPIYRRLPASKPLPHLIHCIGDSHVSFFSGEDRMQPLWPVDSNQLIPIFKSYRLGPVLAYNLCKRRTRSGGREKLFSLLMNHIPPLSRILLCFGEIDCRVHLPKQVQMSNRLLNEIVRECVERYFSVVMEVKRLDYRLTLWNVIPSTLQENTDHVEYAPVGGCMLRNDISRLFNDMLRQLASTEEIEFISIFDSLVDSNGMTDTSYYADEIHLSQRAMPLTLGEISRCMPEFTDRCSDLMSNYGKAASHFSERLANL